MQIDAGMDTGPVFAESVIELDGTETRPEMYERLGDLGASFLAEKLPSILGGNLEAKPQDHAQATEIKMIRKEDGEIDWNKPGEEIERQIRAYLGWPGSRATLFDKEVTITKARCYMSPMERELKSGEILIDKRAVRLFVGSATGPIVIERLKPAGGKEMAASDFVRGLRN